MSSSLSIPALRAISAAGWRPITRGAPASRTHPSGKTLSPSTIIVLSNVSQCNLVISPGSHYLNMGNRICRNVESLKFFSPLYAFRHHLIIDDRNYMGEGKSRINDKTTFWRLLRILSMFVLRIEGGCKKHQVSERCKLCKQNNSSYLSTFTTAAFRHFQHHTSNCCCIH